MQLSSGRVHADDGDNDEAAEEQLRELRDQYQEIASRLADLQSQIDDLQSEADALKKDAAEIWSEGGLDEEEDAELNPENWD